jgi:hypothetical protein
MRDLPTRPLDPLMSICTVHAHMCTSMPVCDSGHAAAGAVDVWGGAGRPATPRWIRSRDTAVSLSLPPALPPSLPPSLSLSPLTVSPSSFLVLHPLPLPAIPFLPLFLLL